MKKLPKQAEKLKTLSAWIVKNKPLYTSWCDCSCCKFYRSEIERLERMTNKNK